MNRYFLIFIFLIITAGGFLFFQNRSQSVTGNDNKLDVAASFYPLYFFAGEIGGDRAVIKNLAPAGSEPHDYEPIAKDIAALENSDLLVVNGAGFEPWYEKIKADLQKKSIHVVETVHSEGVRDPHVWLDPVLAQEQVAKITEGYIVVDQANAEYYKGNGSKLIGKLDRLDAQFRQGLSNCRSKNFVITHSAFAYLAQRYGLNQVSIAGLSPDEEPSARRLAGIADFMREKNVKYIFFETLVSPKLADTIAREVGAKTMVLDPVEGFSDDDIAAGKNYFTVMEENLEKLKIALNCNG